MEKYYLVESIRAAERAEINRYSEDVLMQKAAYAVSYYSRHLLVKTYGKIYGTCVLLLVGGGGNGGDALFAGSYLLSHGVTVHAIEFSPQSTHPHAKNAFLRAGGDFVSEIQSTNYALAIDGISGIGAHGALREPARKIVEQLTCPFLAIDIPTGVDPDTGHYDATAINADVTVTFGAKKIAHIIAQERCGEVQVCKFSPQYYAQLGQPAAISYGSMDCASWPVPGSEDNKYSTGVVGIISGSEKYLGAALLSTGGATAATSGMVRYVGVIHNEIVHVWPDVVATGNLADAGQVQAWAIGPGSGENVINVLQELRDNYREPILIDADAITALSQHPGLLEKFTSTRPVLLTPHAGEFARLFGMDTAQVLASNKIALVRTKAQETQATILLKGKNTIIANPDGKIAIQRAPSSWAATPGSGDVLTGIIGALLAATKEPFLAAAFGAWAHAEAAFFAAQYAQNLEPSLFNDSSFPFIPGAPIRSQQIIAALSLVIRDSRQLCHSLVATSEHKIIP